MNQLRDVLTTDQERGLLELENKFKDLFGNEFIQAINTITECVENNDVARLEEITATGSALLALSSLNHDIDPTTLYYRSAIVYMALELLKVVNNRNNLYNLEQQLNDRD